MTEDRSLARALRELLPHLGYIAARSAREAGSFSIDRLKLLDVLGRLAPVRPGELAGRCYLTPPGVTHATDALVEDGLARREPDPADRRGVLLHVTPKGRRELERVEEAAIAHLERVLAELDPATRAHLRAALPKLIAVLADAREREVFARTS